jgi:hypothetical protein
MKRDGVPEDPRRAILMELRRIPGVGEKTAQDLFDLGFRSVEELRNHDPQIMYEGLCRQKGAHVDRCMLYVFRCAVYFVSHEEHDPELLKWWNWKDNPNHFSQ